MKYQVMKTVTGADGKEVHRVICTARDAIEAEVLVGVLQDGRAEFGNEQAKYWHRETQHGNDA